MNAFIKTARHIALSLALVASLAGSGMVARAEGGGVGSGGYPPPKLGMETLVSYNAESALYSQGSRLYPDGTVVYANGTQSHL